MHHVVVAVGLPASGKTTWLEERGIAPLSSDKMRIALFGNVDEHTRNNQLFAVMRGILKSRMSSGVPWTYIDSTNITRWERSNWIRIAKQHGYKVWALYFDVPLDICLLRNSQRERVIPSNIIEQMSSRLESPSVSEGFDRIITIR